jgi:hypothetical protein
MNCRAILLACCLLSACALDPPHARDDFAEIASLSLRIIERYSSAKATIVIPPGTDAQAQRALTSLRKVVSPDALPQSDEFELPEGYLLLRAFSVSGNTALFEATWGPLYRPKPRVFNGCGQTFRIPAYREQGIWVAHEISETMC